MLFNIFFYNVYFMMKLTLVHNYKSISIVKRNIHLRQSFSGSVEVLSNFSFHKNTSRIQLYLEKYKDLLLSRSMVFLQFPSMISFVYPLNQHCCIPIRIPCNSLSKAVSTHLPIACPAPLYVARSSLKIQPALLGTSELTNDASTLHLIHPGGGLFHCLICGIAPLQSLLPLLIE